MGINKYQNLVTKTRQQHRLFNVQWELTYRCNQRCSHCYLDVQSPETKVADELSTDECLRIIDELVDTGALNLTLTGGEVLVRRDFFEIASYARTKRMLLRIFTNGTLITPERADRIAALHPLKVEISLYGATQETHERITLRPGSFALCIQAVRLLRERKVRTVLKTPVMRENFHELDKLETKALELDAEFRHTTTISPKDSGDCTPLAHSLSDTDLEDVIRTRIDPVYWSSRVLNPDANTCTIGTNTMTIDPYGTVFPCIQTRISAGNLREHSVRNIWEKSPVWEQLRSLLLANLPECAACALRNLCTRCHGLAYLEHGDVKGPATVNCREARMRKKVLAEL